MHCNTQYFENKFVFNQQPKYFTTVTSCFMSSLWSKKPGFYSTRQHGSEKVQSNWTNKVKHSPEKGDMGSEGLWPFTEGTYTGFQT